ncbi:hypothetical protein [Clostridium manihotivorum]|uniref:Uncharacterized protein n=1 Tax=Clostridium manihotivorum TaxID=2320868 RepID=A0A410DTR1_9CLOT|nr:hypothetical protein [Clostridium manihotivorum]QAA32504.1 hypothetical protein C1I91_13140 [Clostridium manihotivorum]
MDKAIKLLAATIMVVSAIAGIVIITLAGIYKAASPRKQMSEENSFNTLSTELKETNNEIKEELSLLKEKVDSIEKKIDKQ